MTPKKPDPGNGLVKKGEPTKLEIAEREGEPIGRTMARVALDPLARHASLASAFASHSIGAGDRSDAMQTIAVLAEEAEKVAGGDLNLASRMLVSQAVSLDALFTELARRSGANMGEYMDASERYMRLALKAQCLGALHATCAEGAMPRSATCDLR